MKDKKIIIALIACLNFIMLVIVWSVNIGVFASYKEVAIFFDETEYTVFDEEYPSGLEEISADYKYSMQAVWYSPNEVYYSGLKVFELIKYKSIYNDEVDEFYEAVNERVDTEIVDYAAQINEVEKQLNKVSTEITNLESTINSLAEKEIEETCGIFACYGEIDNKDEMLDTLDDIKDEYIDMNEQFVEVKDEVVRFQSEEFEIDEGYYEAMNDYGNFVGMMEDIDSEAFDNINESIEDLKGDINEYKAY